MRKKITISEWAWLGLAAYVITVDTTAWRRNQESMSSVFSSWLESPRGKVSCGAAWVIMTSHLFFKTPLPLQKTLKNRIKRKHEG